MRNYDLTRRGPVLISVVTTRNTTSARSVLLPAFSWARGRIASPCTGGPTCCGADLPTDNDWKLPMTYESSCFPLQIRNRGLSFCLALLLSWRSRTLGELS